MHAGLSERVKSITRVVIGIEPVQQKPVLR
jgi:hypothetical protein